MFGRMSTNGHLGIDMNALTLSIAAASGVLAFPLAHTLNVAAGLGPRSRLRAELRKRSRGKLALTYDDGPGVALQPALLDLLARHRARATFYLLGARIEAHPMEAAALVESGHEIGSHSMRHFDASRRILPGHARDLTRGADAVSRLGVATEAFRPPYGRVTWTGLRAARRLALRCDLWTVDSGDTWPDLPVADRCIDLVQREGGGVVLLHSHDRSDREDADRRRNFVLACTEALLDHANRAGLEVVTMSELRGLTHGKKISASASSGIRIPTDQAM